MKDTLLNLFGIAFGDVISGFGLITFTALLVRAAVQFINPLTKKENA